MQPEAIGSSAAGLPQPLQFLIAAGATGPRRAALASMPMSDADWTALPGIAARHGISATLAPGLNERPDMPVAVRCAFDRAHHFNAIHALQAVSELHRILGAMEAADVPAVVLKGPALSQWLYGSATSRRFGDLDILVLPRDRDRAHERLRTLDYNLPSQMPSKVARTIYGALGAWPLTGGGTYPVDLHWRLAHVRFPAPLGAEQVIHDRISIEVGRRAVTIPSPTHTALLTLVHAAKHLWGTLEIVTGIAALTRRHDVDWPVVRRLAEAVHAWNGCSAGLRLAADLLDAEIPRALGEVHAVRSLTEQAMAALRLPAGVFPDRWAERQAHRAAFDRSTDAIRYDLWRLIAPTPLDWEWLRLPARLRWFYVPVRLARLGGAAVRGSLRSTSSEVIEPADGGSASGAAPLHDRSL